MIKQLMWCLSLALTVAISLPAHAEKPAAVNPDDQQIADLHKERKAQALSERTGKKVQKAFEAYSAEDIKGAIAILNDIKPDKDYDKAYVARFLGNMYALTEQNGKAIKALEEAVRIDQLSAVEHAQTLRLLADMKLQDKQYADAIKYYDKWVAFTGKDDAGVYLRKAQALYELKRYADMIAPLDKAIAASPKPDKNAYILKLSSYYERKDYRSSVKVLEQLVALFPDDKRWWSQLGMFYMMVEDYKKALATLEGAYLAGLLTKENEIKALAQLYATNGIPYKSAVLQEKYMKSGLLPRDAKSLAALANTWHSAKELDKAAAVYLEAAAMSGDADLYRKAGNVQMQAEAYAEAAKAFEKALEKGVSSPERVYLALAESYLNRKQYREAYRFVKKAEQYPKTEKTAKSWAAYIEDKVKSTGQTI